MVDGEVIATTEDHLFWSVTDKQFERAEQLAGGEVVLGDGSREVAVSGFRLGTERTALAYNLSIAGVHTYHVGDDAILVHNDCVPTLIYTESQARRGSAALNALLTGDRMQVWSGRWPNEPEVVHSHTNEELLRAPSQYESNAAADAERRFFYVNVNNLPVEENAPRGTS